MDQLAVPIWFLFGAARRMTMTLKEDRYAVKMENPLSPASKSFKLELLKQMRGLDCCHQDPQKGI